MKNKLLACIFFILIISGCAKQNYVDTPLAFDAAVKLIANNLFIQEKNRLGPLAYAKKSYFVVDHILDSDTGEVTKINTHIRELIIQEAATNFSFFSVADMNSETLKNANYIIVGTISHEEHGGSKEKIAHLYLSFVDVKSSEIAARSDVWIASNSFRYEPTPLYKDSPMFIKDQRVAALIATAKAEVGTMVNREYFDSLVTSALLDEASNAYDSAKYTLALGLFAKAAERKDGKVMKTFSGLYQSFFKLGQKDKAEQAFATLVELGMLNKNLSVKFLFKVDETEFSGTQDDLAEYRIWLSQIAKKIKTSGECVQVTGHASRSGSEDHNKKLSLKRAKTIQARLERNAAGIMTKTRSIGRGSEENIIGSGTDDVRDAIDRRVEFKLVQCDKLNAL